MFLKQYRAQPPGPRPYVFPAGTCSRWKNPKSSLTRYRKKTLYYLPSSRTKRFHNLDDLSFFFEMANCCCENRKIDFNTCNISLAIRASKVANRTLLSAIINLKVFIKTGTARRWRSWLQVSVSVVHTNSEAPNVNFRKISVRKTIWDLEFSEHFL